VLFTMIWRSAVTRSLCRLISVALLFGPTGPSTTFAEPRPLTEPEPDHSAEVVGPPEAFKHTSPASQLDWDSGRGKSYVIPAAGILTYIFLLNQYDRHFVEPRDEYRTDGSTIRQQLTDSKWVIDNDQFKVNQFLHPYGGSVYYGLARSSGLSFWESFLYSTAGSFAWEIGGERTNPSINDMITTPIGGSFLGEALFRMASLVLEVDDGRPGFVREVVAAAISPPTGFNRLIFGRRFDAVFPSYTPATFFRLEAGGTLTSSSRNVSSSVNEHGAVGELTLTYGLPGKSGYGYARPFDYFDFHDSAATANTLETITSRGFCWAKPTPRAIRREESGACSAVTTISRRRCSGVQHRPLLGTVWQSWLSERHRTTRHPAGRCRVWRGRQHPAHRGTGLPLWPDPAGTGRAPVDLCQSPDVRL
jgi:hypothetical protein